MFLLLLLAATAAYASNVCSFSLAVSGGISGPVWQLEDGQLRVGGYSTPAIFEIDNGGITDSKGSGCILTPGVRQFQCDRGVGALPGFAVGENGVLSYEKNPTFYACPASNIEWNIYTVPVAGQLKCVTVTLTASNCAAPAYHPPPPPVYQPPPPVYQPPPPVYQPPPPPVYQPPPPPVYQPPPPPVYQPPPPVYQPSPVYQPPAPSVPAPYYNQPPSVSVCTGYLLTICVPSANYGGSSPCICQPSPSHSNVYATPTSPYYAPPATSPYYAPPATSPYYAPPATSPYYAPPSTSHYYAPEPTKYPPKYEKPKYGQPKYGKPKYGQPKYGKPKYGQPKYGKPKYGKPEYGNPYGNPYGKPKYGNPYGNPYSPKYPAYPSYARPYAAVQTVVIPNLDENLLGGILSNDIPGYGASSVKSRDTVEAEQEYEYDDEDDDVDYETEIPATNNTPETNAPTPVSTTFQVMARSMTTNLAKKDNQDSSDVKAGAVFKRGHGR